MLRSKTNWSLVTWGLMVQRHRVRACFPPSYGIISEAHKKSQPVSNHSKTRQIDKLCIMLGIYDMKIYPWNIIPSPLYLQTSMCNWWRVIQPPTYNYWQVYLLCVSGCYIANVLFKKVGLVTNNLACLQTAWFMKWFSRHILFTYMAITES